MAISAILGSDALLPAGLGFRNKIINGDFRINQRAFTSNTTSQTFGFDRWYHEFSGGTCTHTPQSFTVGSPILPGYESSQFARLINSSQTATSHYYLFGQKIEDVRNGDGCTLTVSFYARSGSGTPSVAVELEQNFGSGGSTRVLTYVGKTAISTSWARYSFQITLPSITGKTVGTSSFLLLNLWVSAGSDFSSRTGSIGLQNGTFDFWGVQLEQNRQPTSFEQRPVGVELALCQRYFRRFLNYTLGSGTYSYFATGWRYAANDASFGILFQPEMRTSPSFSASAAATFYLDSNPGGGACTTYATQGITAQAIRLSFSNSGGGRTGDSVTLLQNNSSNSYMDFSAEL